MTSAIEIKNLSVESSGKIILKDINLSLEKGSFTAVIGSNGAGKSTLIKSICGLEKFKGSIKILGNDLKKTDKSIVGYVPQNNVSEKNCPVSVFEAVSIGRYARNGILGRFTAEDHTIVKNAIKTAGIKHLKKTPVGEISGGEAQKVSIARILAQQPEIVLLDEPQAGLDPVAQRSFTSLISRLYAGFKFTCLMVTHDIDLIPAYCKRVLMMKDSSIVMDTDNKNIHNKVKEQRIYG